MQAVRNSSNLLVDLPDHCSVFSHASSGLWSQLRRVGKHALAVHANGGEQLPYAVVQLAGNSSSLFVLQQNHATTQRFELLCLAMQLCEYLDLCPKQFWNYRNGNVIHCTKFVSFQPVQVRRAYRRDEDNGRVLKARMSVDHLC